jgi:hypothetical protein
VLGRVRKRLEGVDSGSLKSPDLGLADIRDLDEMVVLLMTLLAKVPPMTDLAPLAGMGVRFGSALDMIEKPRLEAGVVMEEVDYPVVHLLPVPEHDVGEVGPYALGLRQKIRVEGELDQELRARAAGELGVRTSYECAPRPTPWDLRRKSAWPTIAA